MILKLYSKYKEIIWYLVFGVGTTVVNIASYYCLTRLLGAYDGKDIKNYFAWVFSNVAAWVLSVAFAYITNKLFVFESRSWKFNVIFKESISFLAARLLSFGLDIVILWFGVSILNVKDIYVKIVSNIIVIIVNYVASKLFIFKKSQN